MAQMRAAVLAAHLDAQHAVRAVRALLDYLAVDRTEVARPAATGVEFRVGFEQRRATADAVVDAALVVVPVLAGEGAFGGRVARDLVLRGVELLAPFGVGLVAGVGVGVVVVLAHVGFLSGCGRGEVRKSRLDGGALTKSN
ncbi:hypothetical protein PT2222_310046 [Paraburkholderia tropica]